jgi:excisionase family DNA binding protein
MSLFIPNVLLYDVTTTASILSISKPTVIRLKKSGKLKFHRIGDRILFSEDDISSFIKSCASDTTGGEK